jgi:hypothetical protein
LQQPSIEETSLPILETPFTSQARRLQPRSPIPEFQRSIGESEAPSPVTPNSPNTPDSPSPFRPAEELTMADKGKEKPLSIEATPEQSVHPSRPTTPVREAPPHMAPTDILMHVHTKKLSEDELKKRKKFLTAEQIDKVPIPLMIDANGKKIINFAAFPPGWTIVRGEIRMWTPMIPFQTSWGIIYDNRLEHDPDEETEVHQLYTFFDPIIKNEEEWDAYGNVPRTEPPFQRIEGTWIDIPDINKLVTKLKLVEGKRFKNPHNMLLREHNESLEKANRFRVLIEQSCMYYGDSYSFNWRKAILDDEQEHFWKNELRLLQQICDPTVVKLTMLGSCIMEFRVQLDASAGKALETRLETIQNYGETLGIEPKGPESPDPDEMFSRKGFFFHQFLFYTIQARIHREEILKITARILKKAYQDDPDPSNPWSRMKRPGPHAFKPYLPDEPKEFERMKSWQEMKDQLRRKAIPK